MGGFTICDKPTDIQMPGSKFGAPEIIPRCWKGGWDVLKFMAAEESVLTGGHITRWFVCKAS